MFVIASLHLIGVRGFSDTSLSLGPARAVHEEASDRLPAALSADAAQSVNDSGCLCPAQVTCPPSQSPTVKTNQSSPHSWEAVSWEGEASSIFSHFLFFFTALMFHQQNFQTFFQVQTTDLTSAEMCYFHIHIFFFFFFFNKSPHGALLFALLTALNPPLGNFCLTKSELSSVYVSRSLFIQLIQPLNKSLSLFWVTKFCRILYRKSSAEIRRVLQSTCNICNENDRICSIYQARGADSSAHTTDKTWR